MSQQKIYFNDEKSYFWQVPLERVLDITPFADQRDVKTERVNTIAKAYEEKLKKNNFQSFNMSSPLIMVRSHDLSNLILDREGNRKYACIVDGQHRLKAFKKIQKKYERTKYINIPIVVHVVNTMTEASKIQYDLFEQKPVNAYDKIKRSEYDISNSIELFINQLRAKYNRYIKDNVKYSDKKGFRRTNFLSYELDHEIRNSTNIQSWLDRQIKHNEISEAFQELMDSTFEEYHELNTQKDKLKFLKLTKMPSRPDINRFTVITYKYYKNYQQLVTDIEENMDIIEEYETEEEDRDSDFESVESDNESE